jgi:hypothetical protein
MEHGVQIVAWVSEGATESLYVVLELMWTCEKIYPNYLKYMGIKEIAVVGPLPPHQHIDRSTARIRGHTARRRCGSRRWGIRRGYTGVRGRIVDGNRVQFRYRVRGLHFTHHLLDIGLAS